jgi:hypothetical protein
MSETLAAGVATSNLGARHGHTLRRARAYQPYFAVEPGDVAVAFDDDENPFTLKVVDDPHRRTDASSLIQRRYAWRGYAASPLEVAAGSRVTLAACLDDTTLATITATPDGHDGLYVAGVYPDTVASLRTDGRRLCEFTKLAVDESVRSHAVLGAIFHVAFMYVYQLHRCTDVLIEVNPRHARFYQRMLGFESAGDERYDPAVGAAAVLLRLDLAHSAREIARLAGRRHQRERSFYPYFFGPEDAADIVGRLHGH